MVYHAVKITNDVRADTRHVRFALDDSFEAVPRHFDIDATIA
jgi:hypothetical protein